MSNEAVGWANDQRTNNPAEQLVLLLLGNTAFSDGTVDPVNLAYLAEHARLTPEELQGVLAALQKMGAITWAGSSIRLLLDRVILRPIDGSNADPPE